MNPLLNPAPALADLSLYLPALGLVLLFVVMLPLFLRRERWLIPGTLAGLLVSLAAFGFVEYRDQLTFGKKPFKAQVPPPAQAPRRAAAPAQAAAPAEPAPPPEQPPEPPPPTPKLISVDPNQLKSLPQPGSPSDLKTIRETAPAKPLAAQVPPPAQPPPPAPKPEPIITPTPAPVAPPVVQVPSPAGPSAPKTAPAGGIRLAVASPSATAGHLQVQVQGPLLKTVKVHQPQAHLMIVVDGKYRQVIGPTRIKEDRAAGELGVGGPITAINYFWEGVSVTFENLTAGPHSVMIDNSLDDPATHFAKMIGSESTKNDWNGFVDVSAGQTTTIVFGGKNWMSQQLDRLR